jgi:6-phosphogluconolactonase
VSEVRVLADRATLAATVADDFVKLILTLQGAGTDPQIVLTGGTVAEEIHAAIAAHPDRGAIDWTAIDFWWGDERYVAPDSPDRNAGQARRTLLDPAGATRVHEVPDSTACATPEEAAEAYGVSLRSEGRDRFDLVMLGVGPDGHVASLFPGFPQLHVEDTIAVGVTGSPKPPPERVTLTFPALNRTARVWFVVAGAEKAAAVTSALAPEGTVEETPARGITAPATWYLDPPASGRKLLAGQR